MLNIVIGEKFYIRWQLIIINIIKKMNFLFRLRKIIRLVDNIYILLVILDTNSIMKTC